MTDPIRVAIIGGIVTLLCGGGLVAWFKLRPERRKLGADTELAEAQTDKAQAEVVILLGKTAVELLAPLREEVAAVRADAREVSAELGNVRTQLRGALAQIDSLKDVLRRWHRLIHDDSLDLLQLREAIRADRDAARLRNSKR